MKKREKLCLCGLTNFLGNFSRQITESETSVYVLIFEFPGIFLQSAAAAFIVTRFSANLFCENAKSTRFHGKLSGNVDLFLAKTEKDFRRRNR